MNVGVMERKTGWTQAEEQGSKQRRECRGGVTRRRAVCGKANEETQERP